MSKQIFCPSDTNFTSVSQRIQNKTPTNSIIMPNLPKINLCQTNWQCEDANILSSKIASASVPKDLLNETSDQGDYLRKLMPPPCMTSPPLEEVVEFFTWTLYLNKKLQIAVKGQTKDGFIRGRSIQKRLSNFELMDKSNNIQILQGSISNNEDLPAYIIEKFQNGFPKDWQTVSAIWVDYVRLHKPKEFRWPQPISDLNEDIPDNNSDVSELSSISIGSCDTSDQTITPQMDQTFDLGEKSQNPVKVLSNVIIQSANLVENTVSQIRKRQHSITNDNNLSEESNKRRKITEAFDTIISNMTETLNKLKEDLIATLSDENESIISQNHNSKPTQTEIFLAKDPSPPQRESLKPEVLNIPSSPEYMGIPTKKNFLVNSTRSSYITKRKKRKQSRSNSENITSTKHVDEDCSNISFISKLHMDYNSQSTPKKSSTVLEPIDENQSRNIEVRYMLDTVPNLNIEKIFEKRSENSLLADIVAKNRKLTKISRQSKQQSDSGIVATVTVVNVPEDGDCGTSSEDDNIFDTSSTFRRQIILNTNESSNHTLKNISVSNLQRDFKNNTENKNSSNTIAVEVSKRGRTRCAPLNYWEGQKLEDIIQNTENKGPDQIVAAETPPKRKTGRKTMKKNLIHPALNSEHTQLYSKHGRVKLFDRTVEEDI